MMYPRIWTLLCWSIWKAYSMSNPFQEKVFYVNPSFQKELDSSIQSSTGIVQINLQKMRNISSAYWIDTKDKIIGKNNTLTVEGILEDASQQVPIPIVTLIVYDLPNRDCHALASNGEICCTYKNDGRCDYEASGNCENGIDEYKTTYIDPLVKVISNYQERVPIALIIEPDSLPNLITNKGDPRCGNDATIQAYHTGISYTIEQLSIHAPRTTLYLDASHGGWLGWINNLQSYIDLVLELKLDTHIRGFSTNVANYQSLGIQCPTYDWCLNPDHREDLCCEDPCDLISQYNPANNELNFVLAIHNLSVLTKPSFHPYFIIDTGRNGVSDMRQDCSNWCNIRNAGIGTFPTADTHSSIIDAFLWLKTPGESDGCTQYLPSTQLKKLCPRYDAKCGSSDSIGSREGEPRCPEAGHWFDYQVKQLAENAIWG